MSSKFGLCILELVFEQYAVHICQDVMDLIQNRQKRDVEQLKKLCYNKEEIQLQPSINKHTKFSKLKIDRLCFGSDKDSKVFKHHYSDVVGGYYTYEEVVQKINQGTTPFAKTLKHLMKCSEKDLNVIDITDEGYIVIEPTQLFTGYTEHKKYYNNNKDFGIPVNNISELGTKYSYYNYYCIIL